jgi:hypothetical protein
MLKSPLFEAAGALAALPVDRVQAVANVVTASAAGAPIERGFSGLNHDGTPVQFCISIDATGARYRLLGDPASDERDSGLRYARSLAALDAVLDLGHAAKLRPLVLDMLGAIVGAAPETDPAAYPDGVLWLGAPLAGPGVAVYVDARRGGDEAPDRFRSWLVSLVQPSADEERVVEAVRHGRIMSLGVEGVSPDIARAKVYWRLARPHALSDFAIPLLADRAFAHFVELVIGDREMHLDGVVLSAGLAVPSGKLVDVKLDLCSCPRCLSFDSAGAADLLDRLARTFGLSLPPLDATLRASEVAFLGFGLDRSGDVRLNVYFKPLTPPALEGPP